jgi:hypothetical protein
VSIQQVENMVSLADSHGDKLITKKFFILLKKKKKKKKLLFVFMAFF